MYLHCLCSTRRGSPKANILQGHLQHMLVSGVFSLVCPHGDPAMKSSSGASNQAAFTKQPTVSLCF